MPPSFACASKQLFPFARRNRGWLKVVLQVYALFCAGGLGLAVGISIADGDEWIKDRDLDPSSRWTLAIWYIWCTFHGTSFGEITPASPVGKLIGCVAATLGYWFLLILLSVVLLSQLAGEQEPTVRSVVGRIAGATWPSLLAVFACILVFAALIPIDKFDWEDEGNGTDTGADGSDQAMSYGDKLYFCWVVVFRSPYGDIYPEKLVAKLFTSVLGFVGLLWMPYVLALVAVRRPSQLEHDRLVHALAAPDFDTILLGRGYMAPGEAKEDTRGPTVAPKESDCLRDGDAEA